MVNSFGMQPIKPAFMLCLQKCCYPPHSHLMPKRRRAALASAQNVEFYLLYNTDLVLQCEQCLALGSGL